MGRIIYKWVQALYVKRQRKEKQRERKLSKAELEFLPGALAVEKTPPSPLGRTTAWFLITLVAIGIIWSCVGEVEEVAVAQGKIIPSGYTKTIQTFDTGVVKAIYVQDGGRVKAGDVLIELDTIFTAADLSRLQKEQAYFQLEIKRLTAEQLGIPFVLEPNDGAIPQDMQYQLQLYQSRQAEYQTKLAMAQQIVEQAKANLESAKSSREKLAVQLEIAVDKESKMRELAENGATAKFQYLDYVERRSNVQQDLAAQQSEILKATHSVMQGQESYNNVKRERERDIMTQLVNDRRQQQSIEEELNKAKEKNRLSTIQAPISGTVHQLAVHTIGGVVTSAQPLMLIVPEGAQLEVETWVANKDIGFLYVGQSAEIKVETFNFQKYGTLDATLVELSSDAVDDKDKGLVYRALLRTEANHFALANDKSAYLNPGMAVTAEIKTRKKRIIEYFMDPFIKYRSEGLRER